PDEQAATMRALEMAQTGDLVLVLGDDITRCWKQIIYFNAEGREDQKDSAPTTKVTLPDVPGFEMSGDIDLIRDERGVRIAREEGD
ncbi:MAG: hypothetical protein AB8G16_09835, partial [Gammaproteobacteria bacterium]